MQFALLPSLQAQQAADATISLAQFRQLVADSRPIPAPVPQPKRGTPPPPLPPIDFHAADDAFLQLQLLQARLAATRQSLDRLAGWNKVIQPRVENQSIATLDVDILALAEKQAASEAARLEADLRRAVERANTIAGRAKSAPLVAVVDASAASSSDAEGLSAMEKEVLIRGRDLLMKLFQSYSVGGIDVTELLWYERQAAEAESNYRGWAARAGFAAAAATSAGR